MRRIGIRGIDGLEYAKRDLFNPDSFNDEFLYEIDPEHFGYKVPIKIKIKLRDRIFSNQYVSTKTGFARKKLPKSKSIKMNFLESQFWAYNDEGKLAHTESKYFDESKKNEWSIMLAVSGRMKRRKHK